MDWADLEGLDISLLNQAGGIDILAEQVLKFINTNGMSFNVSSTDKLNNKNQLEH